MISRFLVIILLSLVPLYASAAEIFFEDFSSQEDGAALAGTAWRSLQPDAVSPRSTYMIRNGRLEVDAFSAPKLRGGCVEIDIPLCRRGSIEFDLKIDHNQRGIGLFIDIYNITLFWHDYTKDWRRYFPEPTAKRMPHYSVEPVGHRRLGPVRMGVWAHYKIIFDTDKDRVEYFKDNMDDPVFIDGTVAVLGRQEYLGGKLRIGNWGEMSMSMKFLLDNLKVTSLDDETPVATLSRENILIFNGLSHNRYNISQSLVKAGVAQSKIVNYYLENPKSALTPRNKFFSSGFPGMASAAKARCFVLVDFPCGPDNVLPDYIIQDMLNNVKQGARMVIFGGLVSLGKGEYQQSPLKMLLPVKLADPWQIKQSRLPLSITPASQKFTEGIGWDNPPCVVYYHDLELKPDSEILLKAGDKPLLVRRALGEGEIIVFLGTTCGIVPKDYSQSLFWKWDKWPELARRIVQIDIRKRNNL